MKTVFDKLREQISNDFLIAQQDILPQTTLSSLGFTNHKKVQLILDIEERFEVRFNDQLVDKADTFDQLSQIIEKLRFDAVLNKEIA